MSRNLVVLVDLHNDQIIIFVNIFVNVIHCLNDRANLRIDVSCESHQKIRVVRHYSTIVEDELSARYYLRSHATIVATSIKRIFVLFHVRKCLKQLRKILETCVVFHAHRVEKIAFAEIVSHLRFDNFNQNVVEIHFEIRKFRAYDLIDLLRS